MLLFLIGYMGCGKSTFAKKIARATGLDWVDTDSLIEEREGASVADIFTYNGEEYFRRREAELLDELIRRGNVIVATGGGLPVYGDNMERMMTAGKTVYIRRTPEQILSRLSPFGKQRRPALRGKSDAEILEYMRTNMAAREAVYSRAESIIDCNCTDDYKVTERLLKLIEQN